MLNVKILFFFGVVVAIAAAVPSDHIVGGITPLSGEKLEEAKQQLETSLSKLAAGDGPNYKLGKIISATHQVVSGSSWKYVVELVNDKGETKQCNVGIWSQPWLPNGNQVTIECEGEEKLVKSHD